jgi:TorA maturation chaperone TorD
LDELVLRQQMYGFLWALFAGVPDRSLVDALKDERMQAELARLLAEVPGADRALDRLRICSADELAEDLAVEYTMLFSAPGAAHVPPNESVYRDNLVVETPPQPEINYAGSRRVFAGLYWGDSTVAVAGEYDTEGYEVAGEIPDSLGLELGFMAHLCGRERFFRETGNGLAAEACAYRQAKFLREHLMEWVPTFANRVREKRPSGFYALAALLVLRYLESEVGAAVL